MVDEFYQKVTQIGDIKKGREIGKVALSNSFIWLDCPICLKERWVLLKNGVPQYIKCNDCRLKALSIKMAKVRKGKFVDQQGYVKVFLKQDDFFVTMAQKNGYILEHRLVMAKSLNRCLHRWEIVHHKNHNRSDNRLENLQLVSDDRHTQISILEERISYLEQRVILLEAENVFLMEANDARRVLR